MITVTIIVNQRKNYVTSHLPGSSQQVSYGKIFPSCFSWDIRSLSQQEGLSRATGLPQNVPRDIQFRLYIFKGKLRPRYEGDSPSMS